MPRCVRMSRSGRHRMRIISSEMVSVHGNQLASADSAVERDISRGDPVVSFIPWQANIWRVKQNIVWRPRSPIASIHVLSATNIRCTTCYMYSRSSSCNQCVRLSTTCWKVLRFTLINWLSQRRKRIEDIKININLQRRSSIDNLVFIKAYIHIRLAGWK